MADVDDVQGYEQKFENQLSKLENSDIADADRDAIRSYIRHRDATGDVNTGTLVSHLNRLRLSAERSRTDLVDMDREDVNGLLSRLKREHGLSEGTLRNYRKALRVFFDYRNEPWADDIKIGPSPDRSVDPSELLTQDEIDALLDAAPNSRDRALIAVLADTGLRIGSILSLQLKHLDIDSREATITINDRANVKGASGPKPITWSRAHLSNWLTDHPDTDNDEAPLFCHLQKYYERADDDAALAQQYAAQRVKVAADRAGIDTDRVHAHLFRHTAISQWIRENLHEQAIKRRSGWTEDSDMFSIYSSVRDEEINEQIFDHYDLLEEDTDAPGHSLETCPACKSALRGSEAFCPSCGAALNQAAAEEVDTANDRVVDRGFDTDDLSEQEVARIADRALRNDATFRERVVETLAAELDADLGLTD